MNATRLNTPPEITDESIKQYLADCSSVVRNAQPKDNERLFQRLLKESYGGKPSRVFEFVPCVIGMGDFMVYGKPHNQHFGFFDPETQGYYTNARELLNWGLKWGDILPLIDFTHYRTVQVKAPYFIYGQLSTHTQITSVSHSARYTDSGMGYWVPSEVTHYWKERGEAFGIGYEPQEQWNWIVENYSTKQLQQYMKSKGVTRREVWARGSDMLAYRTATLGGYLSNPNAWPHFINQRMRDPHTQLETRQLVASIEGMME